MKPQSGKQQIGTLIDSDLYRQVRALAILQRRTAGDVIDDAIRAYLAKETVTASPMRRTVAPASPRKCRLDD